MFNCLERRIKFLEKEIPILEARIKAAPSGKLRIYTHDNYSRWMVLLSDGKSQYIKKSEKELVCKLWHKQLDSDSLDLYKRELAILKRDSAAIEKLYASRQKRINRHTNSTLPQDKAVFLPDENWHDIPYHKNPYKQENLTNIGPGGEKMRSKSEVMIAMALAQHNIEYRYECEYPLGCRSVYPDFMIKRPADGEIILWEHFGMWDNEEYLKGAVDKINDYIANGLIPYENFIYSLETESHPTDYSLINDMIETYIL
ncbi:MAG: hypothetical protein DUD27_08905 [Lachnospiraceae bacterium]|nr:MAG: hypothetical protein DUD27_08905 [Lachnospiraceae bacterium]